MNKKIIIQNTKTVVIWWKTILIDIMNNLPLKIFDNNNYNVFKDNETTYSRKIYKIHELMKNCKFICYNLMHNICVICLKGNKYNKLFESEKNDFLSTSFFYCGSGISSQKIYNDNPKFCFLNNEERNNSMCSWVVNISSIKKEEKTLLDECKASLNKLIKTHENPLDQSIVKGYKII